MDETYGTYVDECFKVHDYDDTGNGTDDDTDDDEANTNLGKKFKAAPWGMFKVVITLIFGAIAVTQLLEVW